ncbi:molybdopterin oxidoreductase family protein [Microbacterium capsulatum]|uniref:Molybdopterin oxidoreductase family protein n=1 Tax=Microbacterium capsulatum TaxID=3041921 RepID=A0ABU0XCZ5_9MICO|nr:molybdopterin oxidoreductase family protein [Microbacterium sp. ASV81]MDQ4212827.1 molybdopterin oxidoreductase family protein [Microbacterium sp. ASV81]
MTASPPRTAAASPSTADTHCPYCALQCAMTLTPDPDVSAPVRVEGRMFPTNRGGLCKKGWTSAALLASPERLTTPLIREDGVLRPAGWDEALGRIVSSLRAIRQEDGPDAVAVFGGGGLTNEKAYLLGKFARLALGTSRIDYNGRFCMSSAAAAGNRAFGIDRGLPFPVSDLDDADTILLLGSNVAATMPPLLAHLAGARAAGGLIVVDPRRSQTAELTADGAGTHLQPAPGTDLVLLLGLTHVVLADGLADGDYLAARTTGADVLRRSVAPWWPERVQAATGVPVAALRETAHRLARGRGTYILTGRGVEQHVDGTDTATAAINLALVLGLPGRPGSGYGTLTGQGNGQGGREHGQKSDQLPGYRKIADPADRAAVAAVWGVDPDSLPGPGVPAVQLLGMLGRPEGVRALLVHGANVVISGPDAEAVRSGLGALDLLVVCDFVLSETAALADVVLPVTQWAEEEGTLTTLEGRIIRRRRALVPPAGVRSELEILADLAARLDAPSQWPTDPALVFAELARASAGGIADYSGLSHAQLDAQLDDGVAAHWPYPAGSEGTPRLFLERFAHPDGRARLVPVQPRDRDPDPLEEAPFERAMPGEGAPAVLTLITGRLLEHYQSGAQTRLVAELAEAQPRARAELHPATAARLGIADGDPVTVRNRRGRVVADALLTERIRLDTVFLPFHFADAECANLLTAAETDPISGMPEFKRTTVVVAAGRRRGGAAPVGAAQVRAAQVHA